MLYWKGTVKSRGATYSILFRISHVRFQFNLIQWNINSFFWGGDQKFRIRDDGHQSSLSFFWLISFIFHQIAICTQLSYYFFSFQFYQYRYNLLPDYYKDWYLTIMNSLDTKLRNVNNVLFLMLQFHAVDLIFNWGWIRFIKKLIW